MTREEIINLCSDCLCLGGCTFANKGKEVECAKVDCFSKGYDRAVDKAWHWLYDRINKQGYLDWDDVDELKKAMKGGEE